VQCAFESFEGSEHGRRLNEIDVLVQGLRKTVGRCTDDALSSLTVLVDMVSLDTYQPADRYIYNEMTLLTVFSISSARPTGTRIVTQSFADE
jgi:hypothetical protein